MGLGKERQATQLPNDSRSDEIAAGLMGSRKTAGTLPGKLFQGESRLISSAERYGIRS